MLAGAGSGKTRSLTHRIAYLIDEAGVNPWNILAITFTNKAAQEMRERVDDLVGYGAQDIWISTFHAACSRILRRNIDVIGYEKNFTIYDTGDQKTLMKDVLKEMNINTKQFPERAVLAEISSAKNECKSPAAYREEAYDFRSMKIADIYERYQQRLHDNNALDFDDLLVKTVELFEARPEVLEHYQNRFVYIMVDEYQDTNTVQFLFVSMLARKFQNLCVVGDDDQSIYRFRGANIFNILNFEKEYPDARVIRLEQNYRSSKNILQAANEVIAHNKGRKEKRLWTENDVGELVHFKEYDSEYDEAEGVVSQINFLNMRGERFENMAILYRTNAQSRAFEERLKQRNIPYAIVRGISFYDRKEIKDLMAYLKVVDSGIDDIAVKRIINVPKRGIGQTTVNRIQDYAMEREIGFLDAVMQAETIPDLGRSAAKLTRFADMIRDFRAYLDENSISALLNYIIDQTGYSEELIREGTDEAKSRLDDIDELLNDIINYEEEADDPSLRAFLEEKDMYTLNAGIDNLEDDGNKVLLMTLHNAKGLEFGNVFIGGLEEGLFPSYGATLSGDESEIEEERRLCYVGITRAKKRLFLSAAKRRMVRGQNQYNRHSRFIDEIPGEFLKQDMTASERRFGSRRPGAGSALGQKPGGSSSKYLFGTGGRKPYSLDDFKRNKTGAGQLDYAVGDRVRHIKFGEGKVLEIVRGGRDYEVSVEFDKVGKKKMFASFAKLKKV